MECKLEKITVHYEEFGDGRPIILLHGGPTDHRHMVYDFEPLFEAREGWRRIYPDLPGRGQTPGPDWITNQDQMLEVILDFIDAIIPGERFCVTGLSYGGYMAQGLLYQRAKMIDGVLLVVPSIHLPPEERTPPDEHITLVEDKALLAEVDGQAANMLRSVAVVQNRALLDRYTEVILPALQTADHKFLKRIGGDFSFDVNNLPQPFNKPASLVMIKGGEIAGFSLLRPRPNEQHLAIFGIHPNHRGLSLGEGLLLESMRIAAGQGAERVSLGVDASNEPAVKLYIKTGFKVVSRMIVHSWKLDRWPSPDLQGQLF